MIRKNIIHTVAGVIAAALMVAAPIFSLVTFAGPSDDPVIQAPHVGPGEDEEEYAQALADWAQAIAQNAGSAVNRSVPAAVLAEGNYYDLPNANPMAAAIDMYSYDMMVHDLNNMKQTYPSLVKLQSIGTSLDGRTIYDVIIGNQNASKKILIQAGIHGREYIVSTVAMQQIDALLNGAANGGTFNGMPVSEMLQKVCFHFVPMANPDGVSISQFGEAGVKNAKFREIMQNGFAMDTATGRAGGADYATYLTRWKSNAAGVDINHNFDANWGEIIDAGYGRAVGYKGANPLSEPESKALANLSYSNKFDATLSYHSTGSILYWDTANNRSAQTSYEIASLVHDISGYSIVGSVGHGGYKDWMQKISTVPSLTVEMGTSVCPVNFAEYPEIWQRTKAIPGIIAEYVLKH